MQFLVHEWQDAIERVCIAVAPGAEQHRDLAALPPIWSSAHVRDPRQSNRPADPAGPFADLPHPRREHLSMKAQNGWQTCSPCGLKNNLGEHRRLERPTTP